MIWRLKDTQPHPAFPGDYGEIAYVQEEIPRHQSVVEYSSPTTKPIHFSLFKNGLKVAHDVAVKNGRTQGTLIAKNVPGVPNEPRMPGATQTYSHAHLSTIKTWGDVEEKYQRLLTGRQDVTAPLRVLANSLAPKNLSRQAVIEALFVGVMERVRYVGLEYGIHGFQPARPMNTWERGYGDCKDKALLLMTLLKARGIDSHFVLVRTREEELYPQHRPVGPSLITLCSTCPSRRFF